MDISKAQDELKYDPKFDLSHGLDDTLISNINRLNEDPKKLISSSTRMVLASNPSYKLGKYTKQFEEEVADLPNAKYCSVVEVEAMH